jgi:lipopolysaccharide/colanic/teichoic acid biosynthesis glycosyltransferase
MYKFLIKRIIDLIVSIVLLLILSPLFIIIIFILRLTGEGQVFYFQERIGYKNQKFKIIKFATMIKNSPNIGSGSLTLRNDPRVLPFGRFLRKTKINELTQIINVLLGDMSIVGPRPQMEIDFLCYSIDIRNLIYNSKPGITGIGSVIFRDEESFISKSKDPRKFYKNKIAPYKGRLELWYLNNLSFYNDIKIILLTLWVILYPKSNLQYSMIKDLPKNPSHS